MKLFMQLSYFVAINFHNINTYTILIRGIQAHKSNGIHSLRAKRKFKIYINEQLMKQQCSRPQPLYVGRNMETHCSCPWIASKCLCLPLFSKFSTQVYSQVK